MTTTYKRIKCIKGYLHKFHKDSSQILLPIIPNMEWIITEINDTPYNKTKSLEIKGYGGIHDNEDIIITQTQLLEHFEMLSDVEVED